MKVLSLKQPFAELILQGRKTIELRNWNTKFRGKFLIHSSKIPDIKSMRKFGFSDGDLLCGFILGEVELIETINYKNNPEKFEEDKNKHLADTSFGYYGFVLKNVKRIKPILAKGKLGFWEFEV